MPMKLGCRLLRRGSFYRVVLLDVGRHNDSLGYVAAEVRKNASKESNVSKE